MNSETHQQINEAMHWLESLLQSRVKLGTERMMSWLEKLGHPERAYPCVQVAGTNGKGSLVASLTSILKAAGLNVGSTISPHLVSLHSRQPHLKCSLS